MFFRHCAVSDKHVVCIAESWNSDEFPRISPSCGQVDRRIDNDPSVDPKQQYISRLSKTCVYKAGHGVSSCSLWSMPSEHGASSWGIIMGHLYRFMGHHHLEHEHAQANAACNNATSNCSSERPSHVVFHAAHYFGRFFHAGHQSIVTSMQPLRASSFGA